MRKKLRHRLRAGTTCGARTRRGTRCLRAQVGFGRCVNHGGLTRDSGPKTPEGKLRALANLKPFRDNPEKLAEYLRRSGSPQVKRVEPETCEGSDQNVGQVCRKRKSNEAAVSHASRDAVPVHVGVQDHRAVQRNLDNLAADPAYRGKQP